MKNTNNNIHENQTEQVESAELVELNNEAANLEVAIDQCKKESNQRKVALLCSLMGNIFFLVTAYTIICYDGTGRLFGRLLGVNL